MIIYFIWELICIGSFALMFMYQNKSGASSTFSSNITTDTIDKIIIIFVSIGVLLIMILIFIESLIAWRRIMKQGKGSSQTGAKFPKGANNKYIMEEEKEKSSNLDILKPHLNKDIMNIEEFNNIQDHNEDVSNVSKHTISGFGVVNPTESQLNYDDIIINKHKGDIEGFEIPDNSKFNRKKLIVSSNPEEL